MGAIVQRFSSNKYQENSTLPAFLAFVHGTSGAIQTGKLDKSPCEAHRQNVLSSGQTIKPEEPGVFSQVRRGLSEPHRNCHRTIHPF
jgi:hypothetical protein